MSSQRFNNELRRNQDDPEFDLDSYLDEKAQTNEEQHIKESKNSIYSSFLKNTFLVVGLGVFALLYFNNWSPKQVLGNVFGVEEYQNNVVSTTPETVFPVTSGNGSEVVILDAKDFTGPSVNIEGLENLEKLAKLQALEGLASLEGLSQLENLSRLSALSALSNLDNATIIESKKFTEEFPSTIENYKEGLSEAELGDEFDTETTNDLYDAEVPVSVLKTLKDSNLLRTIDISELIQEYKDRKN